MIKRGLLAGLAIVLCIVSSGWCAVPDEPEIVGPLGERQVIAVIPFQHNGVKLSEKEGARLDRIIASLLQARSKDTVIRVEGFAGADERKIAPTEIALSRAQTVWNYLRLRHNVFSNLYLTGFAESQSATKSQAARVEIAVYADPFVDKMVMNLTAQDGGE